MADNTDNENDRIDRRTVLKASSASIAATAISTPVSAGSGRDGWESADRDSPYHPDVRIVDNSSDADPVVVSYRRIEEDDIDVQEVDEEDREIDSVAVDTIGTNSRQLQDKLTTAVADDVDTDAEIVDPSTVLQDSRGEIERIDIPYNEQIELIARHGDESDSTRINVGERGAATEETALVTIDPDGSVSVNLDIACY